MSLGGKGLRGEGSQLTVVPFMKNKKKCRWNELNFTRWNSRPRERSLCSSTGSCYLYTAVLNKYCSYVMFSLCLCIQQNTNEVNKRSRSFRCFLVAKCSVARTEPFKPGVWNSVRAGLRQLRDPLLGCKILTRQAVPSIDPPQTYVVDLSS
jgi:hypothetical protein